MSPAQAEMAMADTLRTFVCAALTHLEHPRTLGAEEPEIDPSTVQLVEDPCFQPRFPLSSKWFLGMVYRVSEMEVKGRTHEHKDTKQNN